MCDTATPVFIHFVGVSAMQHFRRKPATSRPCGDYGLFLEFWRSLAEHAKPASPPQSRTLARESPSQTSRRFCRSPPLHHSSLQFLIGTQRLTGRHPESILNPQSSILYPFVHGSMPNVTGCHGSCHGSMLRKGPSLLVCHGVTALDPPGTGAGPKP